MDLNAVPSIGLNITRHLFVLFQVIKDNTDLIRNDNVLEIRNESLVTTLLNCNFKALIFYLMKSTSIFIHLSIVYKGEYTYTHTSLFLSTSISIYIDISK